VLLGAQVTREAYSLAFGDAFFAAGVIALLTFFVFIFTRLLAYIRARSVATDPPLSTR
jgi:hypothetical protein